MWSSRGKVNPCTINIMVNLGSPKVTIGSNHSREKIFQKDKKPQHNQIGDAVSVKETISQSESLSASHQSLETSAWHQSTTTKHQPFINFTTHCKSCHPPQ